MKIEESARIPEIAHFPGQREKTQTGFEKSTSGDRAVEQGQEQKISFPGEERLIRAIEKSNSDFKWYDTRLQFSIHEKTKQIMVKVIDNETEEVIREIPPEKILNMVAEMLERTGLFVDRHA